MTNFAGKNNLKDDPLRKFGKLLGQMTAPSLAVTNVEELRQVRLLSALLLAVIFIGAITNLISVLTRPGFKLGMLVLVAFIVVIVLYGISRTRYHRIASVFLVLLIPFLNFGQILFDFEHAEFPEGLYYLSIGVLLCSLLISTRWKVTTALTLLNIAGMLALPLLAPQISFSDLLSPLTAFTFVSVILIIFQINRDQLEKDRTLELEARVKARTHELQQANERLAALSRVKDEFVSNVSHELRTPITNLNLRYHLLERQPDKLDVHLPVVRRETSRLQHIISDLLTLSRMDQDRAELHLTKLDLNELVDQFVADRLPIAEDRGLQLTTECAPSILPVEADAGLIEQVLSVLLTNAFNYTPPGGQVTVTTLSREFENRWWAGFRIKDTGPGIPMAEQGKLFSRFYRGEVGKKSGLAGTGLGLSIAREIVERHHGQIELESAGVAGQGAAFTTWLAAAQKRN